MRTPTRSLLALTALAVVLAACGATAGSPTESTPSPSPPELAGTITIVDGVAAGGPGGSIADALASDSTEPMLVNGVIYQDPDGTIYLADSVTNAVAPTFGGPILEVVNYPENPADWDMDNAEQLGLQEAHGVIYRENAQLFGVVYP